MLSKGIPVLVSLSVLFEPKITVLFLLVIKAIEYPAGHFVGMWMGIAVAIFSGLGIPLSVATGNAGLIGIGPVLGVSFGLAIGLSIEAKHKKEGKIRSLTAEEKRREEKKKNRNNSRYCDPFARGFVFLDSCTH